MFERQLKHNLITVLEKISLMKLMNISGLQSTCLKRPLKQKTKKWFSRPITAFCRSKVLQNAPREHSAILSTFIKLPFVFKTSVLSIFEWLLKTGFAVYGKTKKVYHHYVCRLFFHA